MSEGYVYICRREKSASGLVKIGHTDNIERRVAEFNRETGADSKMILEVAFACAVDLRHSLERAAHHLGRKHRSRGEWFRLSLDEAIETVRAAAAELGINAAICYKKDQPQEITDRIRRQHDEEFAELCRQREAKAAALAAAAHQAEIDAQANMAMQAKARLEDHLHTPPTHDVAALAAIREMEHERALWHANYQIEQSNAALCNKFTFKLIIPLVATGIFFTVHFRLDISPSWFFGGIVSSIILSTIATMLTSSFFAEPLIFAFAKRELPVPADFKFPEVEAAHDRRVESAKAASISAWNARRDELTAACQQATERLDAVTLDQIKFDTTRALSGLKSKIAQSQETLVSKPYGRIEHILSEAYTGRDAIDRSRKDMNDLLIAWHVTEINDHGELRNPARYDLVGTHLGGFDATHPASNITSSDAVATIARLTTVNSNRSEATALVEAIGVYRNMIASLQDFAVMRGLETQATIDRWRERFPNYTPINQTLGRNDIFGADAILGEPCSVLTVPVVSGPAIKLGTLRHEIRPGVSIISPLKATEHFGINLVKRGEMATITQTLLNLAREYAPIIVTVTGERKPIWIVNTLAPIRTVKLLNVYTVMQADGAASPEFYNRNQAIGYADIQRVKWSTANPDLAAEQSPVRIDFLGPLKRVVTERSPPAMSNKNVLVIPENGINHAITFNEQSEVAMAILAGFTDYPQSDAYFHRAS